MTQNAYSEWFRELEKITVLPEKDSDDRYIAEAAALWVGWLCAAITGRDGSTREEQVAAIGECEARYGGDVLGFLVDVGKWAERTKVEHRHRRP